MTHTNKIEKNGGQQDCFFLFIVLFSDKELNWSKKL